MLVPICQEVKTVVCFPYIEPRESQMNFLIKWFDV